MACEHPEIRQKLYRFVRGELADPAEADAVGAHVQECPDCRAVHGELHWLLGTMRRPGGADYEREIRRELGALAGADRPSAAPAASAPAASRLPGWLQRLGRWLSTGGGPVP